MKILYVTTPDLESARKISVQLLQEGLAACTNILPGMESHFHWQGKIETTQECVLLIKTDETHLERARFRIVNLHPYQTPCILTVDLDHVHPAYSQWLKASLLAKS